MLGCMHLVYIEGPVHIHSRAQSSLCHTVRGLSFMTYKISASATMPCLPYCSRLRILAAGGDGTVAWILKTVRELQLEPPPAVAVMPLGTGNDLSLSFGWGNTFLHKWIAVSTYFCDPYKQRLLCFTPNLPHSCISTLRFASTPCSIPVLDINANRGLTCVWSIQIVCLCQRTPRDSAAQKTMSVI